MRQDLVGRTLGDFRLETLIGKGSLATVYQAQQLSFRRTVAVKVLDEGLFAPSTNAQRLLREAEAMARLEHPHLLPVYAVGEEAPYYYFGMPLVRGGSLSDALRKGLQRAVGIGWIHEVCQALAFVHAKGIVHRDLKPGNILIHGSAALLADLGLAHLRDASTLATGGVALGTPLYLSPEQTLGQAAGAPSDCFSLGVILYEVLLGRHPFARPGEKGVLELFKRIRQGEFVPPLQIDATIPPSIHALIAKALKPKAEDRYLNAATLLVDLEAALRALPSVGRAVPGQPPGPGGSARPAAQSAERPGSSVILPPTVRAVWEKTLGSAVLEHGDPGLTYKAAGAQHLARAVPVRSFRAILSRDAVVDGTLPSLGDFLMIEKIGEGGMGTVWQAEQASLRRYVAIKLLKHGFQELSPKEAKEQFLSEALVTAFLGHPNIVPVHSLGEDGEGNLFLAMKLVQGMSWSALLHPSTNAERAKAAEMDFEDHLKILLAVCNAVAFAHSKDIIHRDLKPENVMVGEFGEILVMDWGLALNVSRQPTGPRRAAHCSEVSSASGTPEYMAPEMVEGATEQQGPWTDVYLLGAVLHELLLGAPPHRNTSVLRSLHSASISKPPVFPDSIPQELAGICRRAMARDAADRYPDAFAFRRDLEAFMKHRESLSLTEKADWEGEALASDISSSTAVPSAANQQAFYARYAKLAARYEQALELWPGNTTARARLRATLRAHAEAALKGGDLGLAEAQAAQIEEDTSQRELLDRIQVARTAVLHRERAARRMRRWLQAAAAAIFLCVTIAFFWIRAEQHETERQRQAAVNNELTAERERDIARAEKERAERSAYRLAIEKADKLSAAGCSSDALQVLAATAPNCRGWEYEHLRCRAERNTYKGLLTFTGHTSSVSSLAFSPNGSRLASGSWDKTVKIWETATGKILFNLTDHKNRVAAVSFSPDGSRLASADGDRGGNQETSLDHAVILWEAATGGKLKTFAGLESGINSIAFSPDGTLLAAAGKQNTLIWDVTNGSVVRTIKGGGLSVAFSPNGNCLALAPSWETAVVLLETATGRELRLIKEKTLVMTVAFSPDGTRLATANRDDTINVWDASTGAQLSSMPGHGGLILSLDFSRDGTRLASASYDHSVKIWEPATGKDVMTLRADGSVHAAAFSPDGARLATTAEQRIVLWQASTAKEFIQLPGRQGVGRALVFSSDGTRVASAGGDRTIKVWQVATGKQLLAFEGNTYGVYAVAFSPDGTSLASGGAWLPQGQDTTNCDYSVKLWNAATGDQRLSLKGHKSTINSIVFSPDGRRLASASYDHTVKIWDVSSGTELLTYAGHPSYVFAAAFSPDGLQVASSGPGDNMIRIWEAATGKELFRLKAGAFVGQVAFSPNGAWLAAAGPTIKVWNLATQKEVLTLAGHKNQTLSVSFSPDGKRLASAGTDNTVRIWATATGEELLVLPAQKVHTAVFSPDGKRLAATSTEGNVVWETLTGGLAP